jgi:hypothetical protein
MAARDLSIYQDPRWQRTRLRIFERDNWQCRKCGSTQSNLQVHHKKYESQVPWETADRYLVTLCRTCHERVTELQREVRDIIAEVPVDQIAMLVDMMRRASGLAPDPLRLALDFCNATRTCLASGPWTREASRQLDAVDEAADRIWALIDSNVPRTYGG